MIVRFIFVNLLLAAKKDKENDDDPISDLENYTEEENFKEFLA